MINNERLLVNAVFESEEKLEVSSDDSHISFAGGIQSSMVTVASGANNISGLTEFFGALPKSRQYRTFGVFAGRISIIHQVDWTCKKKFK